MNGLNRSEHNNNNLTEIFKYVTWVPEDDPTQGRNTEIALAAPKEHRGNFRDSSVSVSPVSLHNHIKNTLFLTIPPVPPNSMFALFESYLSSPPKFIANCTSTKVPTETNNIFSTKATSHLSSPALVLSLNLCLVSRL